MENVFANLLGSDEFKEEFVIAEAQARLSDMLEEKGVSRAELARRLGVSRARVSQIFSDEAQNFTLRVLVRSYLALGEEPVVVRRSEYESLRSQTRTSADEPVKMSNDGIAEAVIAKLLKSNVGEGLRSSERNRRVMASAEEWASNEVSNVVPLRRKAHG